MRYPHQLGRWALAACWLAALPAAAAAPSAPVSFRSGDAEITMTEAPWRAAHACASAQCRAMRYAILGTRQPATILASLTLKRHGHVVALPAEGMVDPLLPRLAVACDEVDNCTVRGVFGDGGGTYAAEWIIQNGRATRTVFSNAMDVHQFIGEHLQAPVYR